MNNARGGMVSLIFLADLARFFGVWTLGVWDFQSATPRFPIPPRHAYTAPNLTFSIAMKKLLLLSLVALFAAGMVRAGTTRTDLVNRVEACEAILQEFQLRRETA